MTGPKSPRICAALTDLQSKEIGDKGLRCFSLRRNRHESPIPAKILPRIADFTDSEFTIRATHGKKLPQKQTKATKSRFRIGIVP